MCGLARVPGVASLACCVVGLTFATVSLVAQPVVRPTIHLEGFKTITDLAFDEDGNLYVVEHASGPVFFGGPGRLLKVAPDGTRTTVLGDLDRPTSVAIGSEGELYVTNHGITAGAGEVLRIE
jgi:glucose/arabinose dehydrogenase